MKLDVTVESSAVESKAITGQHWHSNCIVCGKSNPLSMRLSYHTFKDGQLKGQFQAHLWLQGYEGMLHGGVISALLDSAMIHCLFHHGLYAVTGDLHVRFLKAVPCDLVIDLSASITSSKPPLFYMQSSLRVGDNIMARATATMMRKRHHEPDHHEVREPIDVGISNEDTSDD